MCGDGRLQDTAAGAAADAVFIDDPGFREMAGELADLCRIVRRKGTGKVAEPDGGRDCFHITCAGYEELEDLVFRSRGGRRMYNFGEGWETQEAAENFALLRAACDAAYPEDAQPVNFWVREVES